MYTLTPWLYGPCPGIRRKIYTCRTLINTGFTVIMSVYFIGYLVLIECVITFNYRRLQEFVGSTKFSWC
jgi:hypothetical protein